MLAKLDLSKELSSKNAAPFPRLSGALIYYDETPSHRFTTVIAPILGGDYCVALPSRDSFDETLAAAILSFLVQRESCFSANLPLRLLDNFSCPKYFFNTIAALSPKAARQFEHDNRSLSDRAFVAFPIFRCELSGDESPDLLEEIRHGFLPSLDWSRSPCPKVIMAYHNMKNMASSRPRIAKLSTVIFEVEQLQDAEDSWIELENYQKRRCRIVWANGRYILEFSGNELATNDKSSITKMILAFLID